MTQYDPTDAAAGPAPFPITTAVTDIAADGTAVVIGPPPLT